MLGGTYDMQHDTRCDVVGERPGIMREVFRFVYFFFPFYGLINMYMSGGDLVKFHLLT